MTGYRVLRNGTEVGTSTTARYTDGGLNSATSYSYTVKAYDAAGNTSATSSALSVTTSSGQTSGSSFEAEASANNLTGTAAVASCATCSGGSKVGYVGNGATLKFNGVTGGPLTIHYLSAVARTATVQVNGGTPQQVNFPATADWNTVGSITPGITIPAGSNTVTIANTSGWAPDIDRITIGSAPAAASVTVEAEASANNLTGTAAVASCATCSGGSKVGYVGNGATLKFNGVTGGPLTIHYLSAVARTATVQVNGGTPQQVNFPATADWNTVGSITPGITIPAGSNTVTIANTSGWAPDIDRITIG